MKTTHVLMPKIEIYISNTEFGNVYSLIVNDQYQATFSNEADLFSRLDLITRNSFKGGSHV